MEGITEERDKLNLTAKADGAIDPYCIVSPGTDPDEVKQCTDPSEFPVGISGNASENGKSSYVDGDPVTVTYKGGMKYLRMSGVGSRGNRVMSNAVGRGVHHSSQDNVWVIGAASKDWEDEEIIPVEINKQFIAEAVGS